MCTFMCRVTTHSFKHLRIWNTSNACIDLTRLSQLLMQYRHVHMQRNENVNILFKHRGLGGGASLAFTTNNSRKHSGHPLHFFDGHAHLIFQSSASEAHHGMHTSTTIWMVILHAFDCSICLKRSLTRAFGATSTPLQPRAFCLPRVANKSARLLAY